MKLDDVQSKQLLPRFADDVEWIQQAFDVIIKHANERAKSIDAPLSMEAIQALTDEELQALYEQYGIAIYYPDLSRETREKMLFEMCVIYRYLGTPKAIETLCNYIFDGVELNVKVVDNQAFDENGQLVNPSMLDTFDIEVDPQIPVLDTNAHARLLENIIHFSRNSQGLNGINYDFPENFDLSVALGVSGANPVCIVDYINDAICEPVPIPPVFGEPIGGDISATTDNIVYADWGPGTVERGGYAYPDGDLLGMQWNFGGEVEEYDTRPNIEINLGIRWNPPTNTEWLAKTFPANDYWWAGILSNEDLAALQAFGCGYLQTTNPTVAWPGLIGALKFEGEKYDYKIIRMFTGVGEGSIPFDHSNFYLSRDYSSGDPTQYDGCALINSINAFDVAVKTYRVRISDKDPGAIYVLCGFNLSGGSWTAVTFSGNGSYWWAGLIYADDQAKLQALGLISDTSYPYDEILYSDLYEYECVAMYSDMGITPVSFNASDFYVTKSTDYPAIAIFSNAAFSTPVKTWVCRIKKRDYNENLRQTVHRKDTILISK